MMMTKQKLVSTVDWTFLESIHEEGWKFVEREKEGTDKTRAEKHFVI